MEISACHLWWTCHLPAPPEAPARQDVLAGARGRQDWDLSFTKHSLVYRRCRASVIFQILPQLFLNALCICNQYFIVVLFNKTKKALIRRLHGTITQVLMPPPDSFIYYLHIKYCGTTCCNNLLNYIRRNRMYLDGRTATDPFPKWS